MKIGKQKLKIVKTWLKMILIGLDYLHKQEMYIKNLNCGRIYYNGNSGIVCIGDIFMSSRIYQIAFLDKIYDNTELGKIFYFFLIKKLEKYYINCIAPEIFDRNEITEKSDVYSLGMVLIEMLSLEIPYYEIFSHICLKEKILEGFKPLSLEKINHEETINFIKKLTEYNYKSRPFISDLLKDEYLKINDKEDNKIIEILKIKKKTKRGNTLKNPNNNESNTNTTNINLNKTKFSHNLNYKKHNFSTYTNNDSIDKKHSRVNLYNSKNKFNLYKHKFQENPYYEESLKMQGELETDLNKYILPTIHTSDMVIKNENEYSNKNNPQEKNLEKKLNRKSSKNLDKKIDEKFYQKEKTDEIFNIEKVTNFINYPNILSSHEDFITQQSKNNSDFFHTNQDYFENKILTMKEILFKDSVTSSIPKTKSHMNIPNTLDDDNKNNFNLIKSQSHENLFNSNKNILICAPSSINSMNENNFGENENFNTIVNENKKDINTYFTCYGNGNENFSNFKSNENTDKSQNQKNQEQNFFIGKNNFENNKNNENNKENNLYFENSTLTNFDVKINIKNEKIYSNIDDEINTTNNILNSPSFAFNLLTDKNKEKKLGEFKNFNLNLENFNNHSLKNKDNYTNNNIHHIQKNQENLENFPQKKNNSFEYKFDENYKLSPIEKETDMNYNINSSDSNISTKNKDENENRKEIENEKENFDEIYNRPKFQIFDCNYDVHLKFLVNQDFKIHELQFTYNLLKDNIPDLMLEIQNEFNFSSENLNHIYETLKKVSIYSKFYSNSNIIHDNSF